MQLDECDYELPAELVAQHPLKVRDRARMLIVDRTQSSLVHAAGPRSCHPSDPAGCAGGQ